MLEVLATGPLLTVQDTGRWGVHAFGIGTAGAMDVFAARVANTLLGNDCAAPVLEITTGAARLQALRRGVFALCGADLEAGIDGAEVPLCAPFAVEAGQVLRFGRARRGWRACLAVAGGFEAEALFGSAATDLRAAFGGHHGRALARGDRIGFAAHPQPARVPRRIGTTLAHPAQATDAALRLVAAPALAALTDADREWLFGHGLRVSAEADRMGLRLAPALSGAVALAQQLSAAVCFGAVQLPPDGKAIILGADRQTTGGYPLAGVVAGVDHWRIAQARPGDRLVFREVSVEQAQQAWRAREQALARLGIAAASAWQAA
jgi:antagonist of KipI